MAIEEEPGRASPTMAMKKSLEPPEMATQSHGERRASTKKVDGLHSTGFQVHHDSGVPHHIVLRHLDLTTERPERPPTSTKAATLAHYREQINSSTRPWGDFFHGIASSSKWEQQSTVCHETFTKITKEMIH